MGGIDLKFVDGYVDRLCPCVGRGRGVCCVVLCCVVPGSRARVGSTPPHPVIPSPCPTAA